MTFRINPCCCISLRRGTKILAVFDVILTVVILVIMAIMIAALTMMDIEGISDSERKTSLIISIIITIIVLLQLAMAVSLYYGAKRRNYSRCRMWLISTGILLAMSVTSIVANLVLTGFSWSRVTGPLAPISYKLYQAGVVYAFMQKIKRDSSKEENDSENYGMDQPYYDYPYYP